MLLFLISCCFQYFFTIAVDNENVRLRLALAIAIGAPITAANDAIEMLPLIADKTIKYLPKNQRRQYIC